MTLFPNIKLRLVPLNPNFPLPEKTSGPELWPKPEQYLVDRNHQPYEISTEMIIEIKLVNNEQLYKCDIIKYNLKKYRILMNEFLENVRTSSSSFLCENNEQYRKVSSVMDRWLNSVHILIDDPQCNIYPEFIDDNNGIHNESYRIVIGPKNGTAILNSNNVWGMIRALETFSQLVYVHWEQIPVYGGSCLKILINVGHVHDRPRFRYRSLMIDTSRHFLSVPLILKNLDAMAYNKLNILHWHLNDDQSFPFESETFQNFSRLASYGSNYLYTKYDIKKIVEEARLRGIQVIIELDTPGHSLSLGKIFPAIMSQCNDPNHPTMISNIINPSTESTFGILRELMAEMRSMFPSNWIHLGMDDVTYECWSNDHNIKTFMSINDIRSFEKLEQYYLDRIISIVKRLHLKPIIWQDPFDKGIDIPKGTIIQVWKDRKLLYDDPREWRYHVRELIRHNHTVILSACYFLNLIQYGQDWKELYHCDPHDFNGNEHEKQFVIGGEACLWTEYIDETNFLSRTWPRASAVAEKLWSQIIKTNFLDDDVQHRLDAQRCRMLRRKVPAQPISTGYCEYLNPHIDLDIQYKEYDHQSTLESNNESKIIIHQTILDENNNFSPAKTDFFDFQHMAPNQVERNGCTKKINDGHRGFIIIMENNETFTEPAGLIKEVETAVEIFSINSHKEYFKDMKSIVMVWRNSNHSEDFILLSNNQYNKLKIFSNKEFTNFYSLILEYVRVLTHNENNMDPKLRSVTFDFKTPKLLLLFEIINSLKTSKVIVTFGMEMYKSLTIIDKIIRTDGQSGPKINDIDFIFSIDKQVFISINNTHVIPIKPLNHREWFITIENPIIFSIHLKSLFNCPNETIHSDKSRRSKLEKPKVKKFKFFAFIFWLIFVALIASFLMIYVILVVIYLQKQDFSSLDIIKKKINKHKQSLINGQIPKKDLYNYSRKLWMLNPNFMQSTNSLNSPKFQIIQNSQVSDSLDSSKSDESVKYNLNSPGPIRSLSDYGYDDKTYNSLKGGFVMRTDPKN